MSEHSDESSEYGEEEEEEGDSGEESGKDWSELEEEARQGENHVILIYPKKLQIPVCVCVFVCVCIVHAYLRPCPEPLIV